MQDISLKNRHVEETENQKKYGSLYSDLYCLTLSFKTRQSESNPCENDECSRRTALQLSYKVISEFTIAWNSE